MRKSLIIYSLLLALFLGSSLRPAAAMSDASSNSPLDSLAATVGEAIDNEQGLSVDNLITSAPSFDLVRSLILPIVNLANWRLHGPDRYQPPSLVTRNQTFRI